MPDILKDDDLFPYLQGIHLDGKGEQILRVLRAQKESVMGPKGESQKWVVRFHDTSKGLILNKVNTVALVNSTGSRNTDQWPGKLVRLKAEVVLVGRKKMVGIRVNPLAPTDRMVEEYNNSHQKKVEAGKKVVQKANEDLGLAQ